MADERLKDLPRLLERFGTDGQCRAYLVQARWPEGFRRSGCGHDGADSQNERPLEERRVSG